jgi:transcriptional regulator with XRE-family HTH domain
VGYDAGASPVGSRARGLIQQAFAERVGFNRAYIAQIEGSTKNPPGRTPSVLMLEKVARALQVKAGALLE